MKNISRCLWSTVAAVSLLSLAGCGGKNELESKLVGSWKTNDTPMGTAQIMDYNDDGTVTLKMALADLDMKWEVVDNEKIKYWAAAAGEGSATTVEIKVDGDTMTERDVDGGDTMTYTRVPDGTDVTDADDKPLGGASQAEAELTIDDLKNATEEDKKYIEMHQKVVAHLQNSVEIFRKVSTRPANEVANEAQVEFDAAWNLQVNHFGTPARFNEANAKLRSALLKFKSGLNTFRSNEQMDELVEGAKLADEATESLRTQMIAIHNGQ